MKPTGRKGISQLVLKAMGLFGGVQSLTIICSVIRMKFVALWIGVAGVGLFSIFNNAIELISMATQLNIRTSAVRDVAASAGNSMTAKGIMVTIVRRWGWMLGLLGAFVMLVTAPVFSLETFGDYSRTWDFIVLSVCVFFASITSSEGAIMQGLERYKLLAVSSLWGVMGGLVLSIPLFYFLRIDSIIPSILAYSVSMAAAFIFCRVRNVKAPYKVTYRQTWEQGRSFIRLGGYMTVSAFIAQLLNYVFIAWLNIRGGDTAVGFFQAGYTLVNKYVGLVFTALAMEYYPRLTSVIRSRLRSGVFVSHEMSLIMILLIPITTFFIPAAQIIVKILYSDSFLTILPFIVVSMPGMVFRGISWCISFLILARGDGKTYIWTESLSSVIGVGLYIFAYDRWGIDGLGVAFTLWYVVYTIMMFVVMKRIGLRLSRTTVWLSLFTLIIVALQVMFFFMSEMWLMITFALFTSIISIQMIIKLSGSKI